MNQLSHDTLQKEALGKVREKMATDGLGSLVVTDLSVVFWLTGFSGSSAWLLITPERFLLFTDSRYQEQAAGEARMAEIVIARNGFEAEIASGAYDLGGVSGIQSESISWKRALLLCNELGDTIRAVPVASFFEDLRMVKNGIELQRMQRAVSISEQVLEKVLPMIGTDTTELDIAAEISYQHKMLGAEGDSFEPIVASGPRAAMPHARPTSARFLPGELIVIDIGCSYEGYASDQTRTVAFGRASGEARRIYGIVEEAQQLGVDSARCGMSSTELDAVVREHIARSGYGKEFSHSLGHGVGIDVHEEPRISSRSSRILEEHMVFTIEPGIYLPGRFGVRIEDTVVLRRDGAHPFQRFTKQLLEL
ncbi:MAG: aminopeptidase P family protein [Chlorobi bacterium]|nr:aminopeptidase P family protein [Chlorobiota bacterium]